MARPSPTAKPADTGPVGFAGGASTPVTVHLISNDDALWADLTARLPALRWSQHDCVADLVGQVPSTEAAIAVIDARHTSDLDAAIGELLGHAAAVVPVALIEPAQEQTAHRLLRSQVLFEVLPLELAAPAMGERLERAAEEALARRALFSGAAPLPETALPRPASRSGRRPIVIAGGATLLLALVVLGAMMWERSQPASAPKGAPAAVTATAAPRPVAAVDAHAGAADRAADTDTELELARRALRDKHYVEPENDNALSHYQAALALTPDSEEARQGVARVNEALLARAESAVAARDYPAALRALEASRALNPAHPRLATLDTQLSQQRRELTAAQVQAAIDADNFERATTLLSQAESRHLMSVAALAEAREALGRRQGSHEVNSLIRLGTERLAQGLLVEPVRDSAKAYLTEALRRAPPEQNRAVHRLREEYQRALAAQWNNAQARRDTAAAANWLRELQASGISAERAAELSGTEPRATLAAPVGAPATPVVPATAAVTAPAVAAAPPASEPRTVAIAAEPAPAAPPPAPPVVATPPRLSSRLEPIYPSAAERRNLSGWVEVEVRVSAQGTVRDTLVRGAAPPGVFDAAALDALRHARFAPARAADGSAMEAATLIKVRFELPETRR